MKINFVEKFDLYERLEQLSKSVSENEEIHKIVSSGLHDLQEKFNITRMNKMVAEMSNYSWIGDVSKFLDEVEEFKKENKYGLTLESLSLTLQNTNINTYIPVVEKLNLVCALSESDIKSKMHELGKYSFVPQLRRLVEGFKSEEFGAVSKPDIEISSELVSPVLETENGMVFSIDGRDYFTDTKMTVLEAYKGATNKTYEYGKSALKIFKYIGESKFEANFKRGKILVEVNESNEVSFNCNGTIIKDKSALNNWLKHSGVIAYTDTANRSLVEYMYENANKFVKIDFAKNVKSVNESFQLFQIGNNTFISKYDTKQKGYTLNSLDFEEVSELQESLNKKYNVDIKPVLENLSINKEGLEFSSLVEGIELEKLADVTTYKEVYESVDRAVDFYKKLDNKKGTESSKELLESIAKFVNSDKVLFLCATREGIVEKLNEGVVVEEGIKVLNDEIKSLVCAFK